MTSNTARTRQTASPPSSPSPQPGPAPQPQHATPPAMRRLGLCVLAATAALLSACAGLASLPGGDAKPAAASAAPVARAKPVRMKTTSRDIMLEWSTLSVERTPYKRKKSVLSSPLRDAMEDPDFTLTVSQIMANAACRACEDKPYHQMVVNASNRHGVPSSLIHAVIQKESGYNPRATSKKRARGLMQVMPDTARMVGVGSGRQLYDPQTNIYAGTAYLKYLIANHATVDEVLAAYNAGPGNVRKYKGVPPFRETRRYVRDVKKLYVASQ